MRRCERLRGELLDADVVLPAASEALALTEVDRARFPRRHERRFPSFGAIILNKDRHEMSSTLEALGATLFPALPEAADEVRQMADGIQSFALIGSATVELALMASPVMGELELVQLRRSLGPSAIIVCRWADATVRLVQHGQIAVFDGTRWWTKPDARTYASTVRRAVPHAPLDLAQAMLDFCVHSMAPSPGGTVLVWCLDTETLDRLRADSLHTRRAPALALRFAHPVVYSALRHLLSQVDGATAVDARGEVVEIGLHLRASFEAETMVGVSPSKGTRHAAAQRCSHDLPNAVVFVVSDNGPVTVYVRGRTVASIELDAGLDGDNASFLDSTHADPRSVLDSISLRNG